MIFRKKNITRSEEIQQELAGVTGAFEAEEATRNLAEATRRIFHDSDELRKVIEQYENCGLDFRQGRAFEFLEVLKFNRSVAEAGYKELHAYATHFTDSHSPKDIGITKNGHEVLGVQAKSDGSVAQAIRDHAQEKYHGLGRLNPVEQYQHFRDLLEKRLHNAPGDQIYRKAYEDVHHNQMKSLSYDGQGSPGTTRSESEFAAEHPEIVQYMNNGEAVLKEVGTGALQGAGYAAVFATISNGFQNTTKVIRGEKELAEAVVDTLSMTSAAAIRGGIVAGTTKGIAIAARSEGLKTFSEGAAPIALANTIYSMGKAVRLYMKGDIDKTALKEECGEASLRGVSTYYCGVVGQLLIPVPVLGALVGSLVGYTTSALLVQSGILGVGRKNIVYIARKRREYIEEQCLEAVRLMEQYKNSFEQISIQYAKQYTNHILPALTLVNESFNSGNPIMAINGLAYLNECFSKELPFRRFEDFDDFMLDKNSILHL